MEIDPEGKFLKECAKIEAVEADVEKLQGYIKKLRAENKKLSEQISGFEIQGFHNQLAALNNKISAMETSILKTQRTMAFDQLDAVQLHMIENARLQLKEYPSILRRVREHVIAEMAKVNVLIDSSSEPLEVAAQFRKDCVDYSNEHKLKVFRD